MITDDQQSQLRNAAYQFGHGSFGHPDFEEPEVMQLLYYYKYYILTVK